MFYPATPRSGFLARAIAAFQLLTRQGKTTTQYSHVSIADDTGNWQFEAWPPHARKRAIDQGEVFEVWRVNGANENHGITAARWAESHVGQDYDAGRFLFGLFKTRNANICSTFVAEAWTCAGFNITRGAGRWVTPNDVVSSGALKRIG